MSKFVRVFAGVALAGAVLAACGGDDGADVRTLGCPSGSASGSASSAASGSETEHGSESGSASGSETEHGSESGSASGSASCPESGSASASASASGSGSAAAKCEPVGDISTATTTVNVELDEWTIIPDVESVAAGQIGFVAENIGAEDHEIVIVKGVASEDLPKNEDGSLDEAQLPEGALIGEIEAFPAGETCEGVFELTAGDYLLVCNVVEEEHAEHGPHLDEGMVNTFTVT